MVRTITPEQIISESSNEALKKRKLNPSVCEPSDETIMNILNYSKAVKAVSSSKTGTIVNVMN